MKICQDICKKLLPLSEFTKDKSTPDGLDKKCKHCKSSRHAAKREVRKITRKLSYEKNKAHELAKCQEYRNFHKEERAVYFKEYSKKFPWMSAAKTARYRAAKKQATPLWLTPQQDAEILEIYRTCPKGYDVDHIIPLQGKNVRGLHVPWNLQHLPLEINRYKKRAKTD